ncbi:MAG: NAD-dependent epimerase/dehydratase family protein [Armatimonadetes bacterium]|nr:NAD-dependent epimerase/dehydratase family protein [Armatimonadota bacterium]
MKKVFVTGGTGFVGAHVVRKLVERGDRVTALVRLQSNTSLIQRLPVEYVVGNVTKMDSFLPALEGIDELYHVAADYRLWARDAREIYFNNVSGTLNVMEAALRQHVPKVVYTSTVGCLGIPNDGSPGDEDTPVTRNELVGHYKKSKYDAERIALDYARKGLNVVIVNPSTPVGPGDIKPTPTGKIVLDFLNGKMRGYVDTGLNLVAVEDVAEGHLLAARKGRIGERYILGNRNVTLREILETLAVITSRKSPTLRVPGWVALAAAIADTAAARLSDREPNIPIEGVLMSRKKMFFSADKAICELGLPQSPIEDALAGSVGWFREHGYVKAPG